MISTSAPYSDKLKVSKKSVPKLLKSLSDFMNIFSSVILR